MKRSFNEQKIRDFCESANEVSTSKKIRDFCENLKRKFRKAEPRSFAVKSQRQYRKEYEEKKMILLHKKDIAKYLGMDARLDAALQMIASGEADQDAEGRYEDSDRMYHMVQRYVTKSHAEARWESHEYWIDIQYMKSGEERMDILVSKEGLKETERPEGADCIFYEKADAKNLSGEQTLRMGAGMLAVYYPEDIHKPGISVESPCEVEKIVFKIHV